MGYFLNASGIDATEIIDYKAVSKLSSEKRQELVKECKLTEEEAVEIVNICPQTMSELRSFTFGWKKLILTETLEKILKIIKANS